MQQEIILAVLFEFDKATKERGGGGWKGGWSKRRGNHQRSKKLVTTIAKNTPASTLQEGFNKEEASLP